MEIETETMLLGDQKAKLEIVCECVDIPPVPADGASSSPKKGDGVLLEFCDQRFMKFMTDASVVDATVPESQVSPRNENILDEYFRSIKEGPSGLPSLGVSPSAVNGGRPVPRRGLGPRVFIGFDAEWQFEKKGKNRILSVQFHLIGPTGKELQKVIHLRGAGAVEERPSLRQALCDLLEEAEDNGIMEDWPREVVLVGFFTRADITVFSDFKKIRSEFDGVGGTLVTVSQAAKLELPMTNRRENKLKSKYQFTVGDAFDPRQLRVRLVDSSRLAPPGKSLAALGQWLGLEKIELPAGYAKDEMAKFQAKDIKRFEAYGLRDAEIAVMYLLWVYWFSNRYLGLNALSATASGLAVKMAEQCIKKDGVALDVALNYDEKAVSRWNNDTGRAVTQKRRAPKQVRQWFESFLADTYIGGRNECYLFGATERQTFFDPDLSGAYLTGLAYVMALDYENAVTTKDLSAFCGHVAGYAQVNFRFPAGTRFPCLPVTVENRGIYFPLTGESLCTAPEIELALMMGAEIEIKFGLIIPWLDRAAVFERSKACRPKKSPKKKDDEELDADVFEPHPSQKMEFPPAHHGDNGYRLFESFAICIREMRSQFPRKSLPFEFVKLLGNSVYGKTGQGFKKKRTFGPREMGSVIVGPSRLSEAAVASLVCGFVRAVLGEILWKLPLSATVVSATTDGFLLDLPPDQLDLSGEMCRRFQALVDRVAPGSSMLENKHRVKQVVAMRTRGQLTGEADGDHPIVLAKAGVKPDRQVENENAFMIDLFLNRQPNQTMPQESFISMREQLMSGWDLQTQRRDIRINLDFDFKRRPINPRMTVVSCAGVEHLGFDTEPWTTVEEGALARLIFDEWRKTGCLKNLNDWQEWQAFYAFKTSNRRRSATGKVIAEGGEGIAIGSSQGATGLVYRTKRSGYLGAAVRTFLTAFVKRGWGLETADLSQRELAEWLSGQGYETRLSSVKNAGRGLLNEQSIPRTDDVLKFLAVVQGRFPRFEGSRMLIFSPSN